MAGISLTNDTNRSMAISDLISGIKQFRLWHFLAITETRRRYRRTVIGPFWASLSIGIFIACMSIVLSGLWGANQKDFLPYFCSGYICWMLFSGIVSEACITFTGNEGFLKQLSIPYVIYPFLTTWRNFITFAHHLVIFVLVLLYCRHPININLLFVIPGLAITFIAGTWTCLLLGMLCSRYRDIQQIITNMLQLVMFVSPIMWKPEQLGRKGLLISEFNPVYHYISIIRMPLIGQVPPLQTWLVAIIFTTVLGLITFELFTKKYRTLIYWL